MNRDCNGDKFIRATKLWGRCLGNGAVFHLTPGLSECPSCHRTWAPVSTETTKLQWNPDNDVDVLRTIDVPLLKEIAEAYFSIKFFPHGLAGMAATLAVLPEEAEKRNALYPRGRYLTETADRTPAVQEGK